MATCAADRCNTPAADGDIYCPYHQEDAYRLRRDLDRRSSIPRAPDPDYVTTDGKGLSAGSGILIGGAAGLFLLGVVGGIIVCAQVFP